ncbi:MAG: phage terminase large subunit family protein [Planctomycetaceae bacterium]|nr:phage terminase large subunit family protein [Planctomycetaceae bacterium]
MKKIIKKSVKHSKKKAAKKAIKKATKKAVKKSIERRGRPRKHSDKKAGELNRLKNAARWRIQTDESNDIGEIPKIKNIKRREKTKKDFVQFCKIYGGQEAFYRDWVPAHYEIAESVQDVVTNGVKRAIAAPRGFCKSTFLRWGTLYALLQYPELHKYIVYLGAVGGATERSHQYILNQLRFNELLKEDFPEVCYPLSCYGKSTVRDIKYKGISINASFRDSKIVLPTVKGYELSGSAISFYSIGSEGIRGADHTIFTSAYRPSMIDIDDPQSDMSAHSLKLVTGMHKIITGTVRNLGGYSRITKRRQKTGVLAMCTCIAPNDLAIQLLDKKKSPDYLGRIYRRLSRLPNNMELWRKYKEIRTESLIDTGNKIKATEFYKKYQKQMDAGCEVIDAADYEDDMISAIQFAMDMWCEDEYTFFTEQQNNPIAALESGEGYLTPSRVLEKVIPKPRLYVPDDTAIVTAHIDIGKHLLWYCVTAWGYEKKFGHIVDYGVYPQQVSPFFRKENYEVSLQDFYTDGDEYERIVEAIHDLVKRIFEQNYLCNGGRFDINRLSNLNQFVTKKPLSMLAFCGIDAADGMYEKAIWNAIRSSPYRDRLMPMYGAAAQGQLYRYLSLHLGERRREGCDWIANPESKKRRYMGDINVTSLKYDVNTYKTEINSALLIQANREGTITIFDGSIEEHQMFSEQLCSEEYQTFRISANKYHKWKLKKPEVADNDLFDTLVGTAALASFADVESAVNKTILRNKKDRPRIKASEIQKGKNYGR